MQLYLSQDFSTLIFFILVLFLEAKGAQIKQEKIEQYLLQAVQVFVSLQKIQKILDMLQDLELMK